jgi:RimJ/RimL family protein N-acetyltransferase
MSQTDLDLLAIEAATIYVLTDSGRILHRSSPDRKEGTRFRLAVCRSGSVVQLRHDVDESTALAIEYLAAREPALWHPDGAPVQLNEYRRVLAVETPVEESDAGLIWTFPDRLDYDHSAELVSSDTPAGDRLIARLNERGMPEPLFDLGFVDIGEFWAPWCIALQGDEIASIAFTVGLGPAGAEVGVATVPAFRGRGYAAAATAGWASLSAHSGRVLFYGASRANVSSQRVTQRLGLRLIGTDLTIS